MSNRVSWVWDETVDGDYYLDSWDREFDLAYRLFFGKPVPSKWEYHPNDPMLRALWEGLNADI
jgi:hypothetical protein